MGPQPRRSEGADRTLAAALQRAAAAQRPWLQTPGDRSPELVRTRYHPPRTHCLIGYKFHTQVTRMKKTSCPECEGIAIEQAIRSPGELRRVVSVVSEEVARSVLEQEPLPPEPGVDQPVVGEL